MSVANLQPALAHRSSSIAQPSSTVPLNETIALQLRTLGARIIEQDEIQEATVVPERLLHEQKERQEKLSVQPDR